jgi:hypothetical protein
LVDEITEHPKEHSLSLSLLDPLPSKIYTGIQLDIRVAVSCSQACDLASSLLRLSDDNTVSETKLEKEDDKYVGKFLVKAPDEPGTYNWQLIFPQQEIGGTIHQEARLHLLLTVLPHEISLNVWDVPLPVVIRQDFSFTVGAKCMAECNLKGDLIEVYDEGGNKLATGLMGDTPWPATKAVYFARLVAKAPAAEGVYTWTAKFIPSPNSPHKEVSRSFSFRSSRPGEHTVRVEVVDKFTGKPIRRPYVFIKPFRAYGDDSGVASLVVPQGDHQVFISAPGYQEKTIELKVDGDVQVKEELIIAPTF